MAGRLGPTQLLALVLRARSYSLEQVGEMTRRSPSDLRALLAEAAPALGVRDERAAIAEARRRGLLD